MDDALKCFWDLFEADCHKTRREIIAVLIGGANKVFLFERKQRRRRLDELRLQYD